MSFLSNFFGGKDSTPESDAKKDQSGQPKPPIQIGAGNPIPFAVKTATPDKKDEPAKKPVSNALFAGMQMKAPTTTTGPAPAPITGAGGFNFIKNAKPKEEPKLSFGLDQPGGGFGVYDQTNSSLQTQPPEEDSFRPQQQEVTPPAQGQSKGGFSFIRGKAPSVSQKTGPPPPEFWSTSTPQIGGEQNSNEPDIVSFNQPEQSPQHYSEDVLNLPRQNSSSLGYDYQQSNFYQQPPVQEQPPAPAPAKKGFGFIKSSPAPTPKVEAPPIEEPIGKPVEQEIYRPPLVGQQELLGHHEDQIYSGYQHQIHHEDEYVHQHQHQHHELSTKEEEVKYEALTLMAELQQKQHEKSPNNNEEHYSPQQHHDSMLEEKARRASHAIISTKETPGEFIERTEYRKFWFKKKLHEIITKENALISKKSKELQPRFAIIFLSLLVDNEAEKVKLQGEIKNVLTQQEEAIKHENFEEAEQCESELQRKRERILVLEHEIRSSLTLTQALQKEKVKVFRDEIEDAPKIIAEISKYELEHESFVGKFKEKEQKKLSNEKEFLDSEKDRLKIAQNHIEMDMQHVEEERVQVEESLNKMTHEMKEQEGELVNKKSELEATIEQLEKELEAKRNELSSVNGNLEEVGSKIRGVQAKFEGQLSKILGRRTKIEEEKASHEIEKSKMEEVLAKAQAAEEEFGRKSAELDSQTARMKELKSTLGENEARLKSLQSKREALVDDYNSYVGLMVSRGEEVEKLVESNADLERKITSAEQQISKIQVEKSQLQQKIASADQEKKAAVAARNFKAASQFTAEIKDIQNMIESFEKQTSELLESQCTMKEQIEGNVVKIDSIRKNTAEVLVVIDTKRLEILSFEIQDLREAIVEATRMKDDEMVGTLNEALGKLENEKMTLQSKLPPELHPKEEETKSQLHQDNNVAPVGKENETEDRAQKAREEAAQIAEEAEARAKEELNMEVPSPQVTEKPLNELSVEELKQKEEEFTKAIDSLEQEINTMDADLQAAVEKEDFETADNLNTLIDIKKSEQEKNRENLSRVQELLKEKETLAQPEQEKEVHQEEEQQNSLPVESTPAEITEPKEEEPAQVQKENEPSEEKKEEEPKIEEHGGMVIEEENVSPQNKSPKTPVVDDDLLG